VRKKHFKEKNSKKKTLQLKTNFEIFSPTLAHTYKKKCKGKKIGLKTPKNQQSTTRRCQ
jgi:hypothetical protein